MFVPFAPRAEVAPIDLRLHCLELVSGPVSRLRHIIGQLDMNIGRTPPSDIIIADTEISRVHCSVAQRDGQIIVTDLNSTNGTFIDEVKLAQPTKLPVGAVLRIGRQEFRHEWRTQSEIAQTDEFDRELERANNYVRALLPEPRLGGPIRADWFLQPCARLGGDAFGYGDVTENHFSVYLIDVAGHGAGAAMHSVAVMNLLRQRALPDTDMTDPAQVLATLNDLFQMERHAELYFTMWYGVYDRRSRRLEYASGGHHPAYMVSADRNDLVAMYARNSLIGAVPGKTYRAESAVLPPGASIYLFSDGVFEIVTRDGAQWGLNDFLPLLRNQPAPDPLMLNPQPPGMTRSRQLFEQVSKIARPGGFDDDFSLVVLTFD